MKKVKLEDIVDMLQIRFAEQTVFYNKETGETIIVSDDDFRFVDNDDFENKLENCPNWQKEHLKEVYKLEFEDYDKYIKLPGAFEIRDSDIMEEFIENIDNERKKYELENCMWQKGMYRKFKDKLIEMELKKEYYRFYDEKLKEIAIKWCKENNLEYEE